MATEPENDIQERMRDWMDAAQKPEAPLSNTELRNVRLVLESVGRRKWLLKQIYVAAPWLITVFVGVSAGWRWIVAQITGGSTP